MESVHVPDHGLKLSRNHKAMLATKLHPACLDGEPQNSSGLALTVGVASGRNELTERQGFLPAIGFHVLKYELVNRTGAKGCSPHQRFHKWELLSLRQDAHDFARSLLAEKAGSTAIPRRCFRPRVLVWCRTSNIC